MTVASATLRPCSSQPAGFLQHVVTCSAHAALRSGFRSICGIGQGVDQCGERGDVVDRAKLVDVGQQRLDAEGLRFEALIAEQWIEPDQPPGAPVQPRDFGTNAFASAVAVEAIW